MKAILRSLSSALKNRPMVLGILAETAFVLALCAGGLFVCTLLGLG